MNKRTIGVLNAITKYNNLHIDDRRLVIIEPRGIGFVSQKNCEPFLSFEELTAEDFFEIYRYKKSLERDKDKKGND